MSSKSAGNAEGLTLAKVRQVRDVMKRTDTSWRANWRRVAKSVMPRKSPPKLSPQEERVNARLHQSKSCTVFHLYWNARGITVAKALHVSDRKQQQHVGVIIARLNKKRRKYVIVPGGKDAPRTYKLTRRR